jgi:hypothetical protein
MTDAPTGRTAAFHILATGYTTSIDRDVLRASRERVLAVADVIVPGHGAPFAPTATTPR